jgi:hypothetical protein
MAEQKDLLKTSDVHILKEKNDLSQRERHFIESQNHCALCNTKLQIKVESYLEDYFLREEAECPTCQIKTRVKNHKMQ